MSSSPQQSFRLMLFLRTWHRRLGVFVFLMVVWLALTGILINHSDELGFNKHLLKNDWLKAMYGLNPVPEKHSAYSNGQHYFHCYDNQFYVDAHPYAECSGALQHFLKAQDYVVLANEREIFLLDTTSRFLELVRLDDFVLPLDTVYMLEANHMVLVAHNQQAYLMNLDSLSVERFFPVFDVSGIEAAVKTELPQALHAELVFPGINMERVLLDLHSGRLFGKAGVWVVDFFALLFVVLSLGGLCIFFYPKR